LAENLTLLLSVTLSNDYLKYFCTQKKHLAQCFLTSVDRATF